MSDAGLQANLTLDISSALRQVEGLEEAVSRAVTDVSATVDTSAVTDAIADLEPVVDVEGNAEPVTEAVDSAIADVDAAVTVEGDAEPVTAAIDEAVAAADPVVSVDATTDDAAAEIDALASSVEPIVVTVEADTSGVDGALQDVQQNAEGAASSVDKLSGSTAGLGDAAGIAGGGVDNLSGLLGPIAGKAGAAGAGLAAFAGFADLTFGKALAAGEATRRFNDVLGDMADEVLHVDVGGLNQDLGALDLSLGSGTAQVKQAVASFFQLGESSGVAREKVAASSEQLVALAANARATNPALGSIGDIVEGLSRGLARGGRFLGQYGIALTAAEINARALADTGKNSASELTQFDKAAAGAALATEKLGDSIKENVTEGVDNPVIALDRLQVQFNKVLTELGKPLIIPILRILEESEPLLIAMAEAFGEIVTALLPLLEILAELSPLLRLGLVPVIAITKALNLMIAPVVFLADKIEALIGDLGGFADVLRSIPDAIGDFISNIPGVSAVGDAFSKVGAVLGTVKDDIADVAGDIGDFGSDFAGGVADTLGAGNDLEGGLVDNFDAIVAATAAHETAITEAERIVRKALEDEKVATLELGKANAETFTKMNTEINRFVDAATSALPSIADAFKNTGEDAKLSARELTEALTQQAEDLAAFRTNLTTLTEAGFSELAAIIAEQGPEVGGDLAGQLATAIDAGNTEIVQGVQDATDAFESEWNSSVEFFRAVLGPRMVLEAFITAADVTKAFGSNLSLAEKIRIAGEVASLAMDDAGKVVAELAATAGAETAIAYGKSLGLADETINASLAAGKAIKDHAPKDAASEAGRDLGAAFALGIAEGFDNSLGIVTNVVDHGVFIIRDSAGHAAGVSSPSRLFAETIGLPIAQGIAVGIEEGIPDIEDATLKAIDAAQVAVDQNALVPTIADPVPVRISTLATAAALTGVPAGGMTVTFESGAIVLQFSGAVPTEAEGRRLAQLVGEEIADVIEARQVAFDDRAVNGG